MKRKNQRRYRFSKRISDYSFDTVAKIYKPRWTFPLKHTRTLTMNVGTLYPIDIQEAYPGDEFIDKDNFVATLLSSYLKPNMGNMFMEVHTFFVPLEQVYDDFFKVFGLARPSQYDEPVYASVPTVDDVPGKTVNVVTNSVFDHLYALPRLDTMSDNFRVSLLPARAFAHIYNEWYRDENNIDEVDVQHGEAVASEMPNAESWSPTNYTGMLPKVRKLHDYFTSCLPKPQKGESVSLPLGNIAPVVPMASEWPQLVTGGQNPTYIRYVDGEPVKDSTNNPMVANYNGSGTSQVWISSDSIGSGGDTGKGTLFTNYGADLTQASGANINDLRLAFATQRVLERDARYGSRYSEYVQANFGVRPPDLNLGRPEYICGYRAPMSAHVVPQTSQGTAESPLGALAAYGNSAGRGRWHKAVTQHGYFITCASIRQMHLYQQGCERFLTRKERFDFLDTEFVHLGEQPVTKGEIFFTGTEADKEPFGFNEIYADMRYRPSTVTGQARSGALLPGGSDSDLDIWHLGDNYSNAPSLNQQFIEETPVYLDRGISVPSESQDQFIVQFYFDRQGIRPIPARGTPGRIDHAFGG